MSDTELREGEGWPPVPDGVGMLVEALDAVEPVFHDRLLGPAVALAESHPVGTFRRKLRALIDTVRAVTLTQRHEEAVRQRRVVAEPCADGMGWLQLYGPMVEVQ